MTTYDARIGLCDDQKETLRALRDLIKGINLRLGGNWEIRLFSNAHDMLNCVENIDILFLDIDMPKMDGIEAGRRVLEKNPDCSIIMATGMAERFKEAFTLRAFRFVTKPFDEAEVQSALNDALLQNISTIAIDVYRDRLPFSLRQKDIRYVRAFNGYVLLYAGNEEYRKDCSLDDIKSVLNPRLFYQIHRSYLVGFGWITSYDPLHVFIGDVSLPLSRRRFSDFKTSLAAYELEFCK